MNICGVAYDTIALKTVTNEKRRLQMECTQ